MVGPDGKPVTIAVNRQDGKQMTHQELHQMMQQNKETIDKNVQHAARARIQMEKEA